MRKGDQLCILRAEVKTDADALNLLRLVAALTAIGIAGQASIDKVAGPVGEALIMTAFGLAVAVPAVMGYNWLIRRNKGAMESVRTFSGDILNVLLAGKR